VLWGPSVLRRGDSEFVVGRRFWVYVARPKNVRLTVAGKRVDLPARRNVRTVVSG
jgi:hypothetical protein